MEDLALLEQALALDSTFAQAHAHMAMTLVNIDWVARRSQFYHHAQSAYRYRDRLTELERYTVETIYHAYVNIDWEKMTRAAENWLRVDPDGPVEPLVISYLYHNDRVEDAVDLVLTSWSPEDPLRFPAYFDALATVDSIDALRAFVASGRERGVHRSDHMHALLLIRDEQFEELTVFADSTDLWREMSTLPIRVIARLERGMLAEAEELIKRMVPNRLDNGAMGLYKLLHWAWQSLVIAGDTTRAKQAMHVLLDRFPVDHPTGGMFHIDASYLYGVLGYTEPVRETLDLWKGRSDIWMGTSTPKTFQEDKTMRGYKARAEAILAYNEGRYEDALAAIDIPGMRVHEPFPTWTIFVRGPSLEALGRDEEAIAAYQAAFRVNYYASVWWDAYTRPFSRMRLGAIYERQGKWAEAAEQWDRLARQWKDADPEIQPRVEEAKRHRDAALARMVVAG